MADDVIGDLRGDLRIRYERLAMRFRAHGADEMARKCQRNARRSAPTYSLLVSAAELERLCNDLRRQRDGVPQ